jgi:hypothetical protein
MHPSDDDKSKSDPLKRLEANMVSLRAALLAMHAKLEYTALMLRLDEARKADRGAPRRTP